MLLHMVKFWGVCITKFDFSSRRFMFNVITHPFCGVSVCFFSSVYLCSDVDCIFARIKDISIDLPSKQTFPSDPYLHPSKIHNLIFYVSDVLKVHFKISLIYSQSYVDFYCRIPMFLGVFGNSSYRVIVKASTFLSTWY